MRIQRWVGRRRTDCVDARNAVDQVMNMERASVAFVLRHQGAVASRFAVMASLHFRDRGQTSDSFMEHTCLGAGGAQAPLTQQNI